MTERGVDSELHACLKRYWGYDRFLEGQLEICMNVLRNKDSFVIMATGSGKSLTFQLPAVYLREKGIRATAIVASPLISLIDDQVAALLAMGIPACAVGSNSSADIEARAARGEFTVMYATPEKLLSWQNGLRELSRVAHIACFAVDESHCVSEWGHDFRPDYRRLGELRDLLGPKVPWIGLTASATTAVQADIVRNLRLRQPLVAKASLNRPNLKYCVVNRNGPNDLLRLINDYRKEQLLSYPRTIDKASIPFYSTLVYANSKRETEELAKLLVECRLLSGIKVAYYHAGMDAVERSAVHMAFSKDEIQVVIATIAFGMGINKPDVRMVIHYGMTKSVESYYQQTGRAGRDGLPARCVLLFCRSDVVRCFNISASSLSAAAAQEVTPTWGSYDPPIGSCRLDPTAPLTAEQHAQQTPTQRLNHQIGCMKEYSTTCGKFRCRRKYLMHYFGEPLEGLEATEICVSGANGVRYFASRNCCDLCDDAIRQHELAQTLAADGAEGVAAGGAGSEADVSVGDISKEVHMLLSTIIDCGEQYGLGVPLGVLLGKHDKSVQRVRGYSEFAHFGCGALHSNDWWKALTEQLVDVDRYVEAVLTKMSNGAFSFQRYVVTEAGRRFLTGGFPFANRGPFDASVHKYKTPCTRELRALMHVEKQLKRPPLTQQLPPTTGLGRSRSIGATPSSVRPTSKATPLFSIVPGEMAFDPQQAAQYVTSGGRGGQVKELAVAAAEEERASITKELSTLLERQLRQTRNDIAQRSGLHPYSVLAAPDIAVLVQAAPTTIAELGKLAGWGDWKLRNFGQTFVDAVVRFKAEQAKKYAALQAAEDTIAAAAASSVSAGGGEGVEVPGSNTLLNGGYTASRAGAEVGSPGAVVPVRPAVRLYRPNYEAAGASAVLDSSTEVSHRDQVGASSSGSGSGGGGTGSSCSVAQVAAVEKVVPPTAYQGTGTDDEDSENRENSGDSQDSLEIVDDQKRPAVGGGSGTSSAYAVAARKRQLAHTGIAAFKAKKQAVGGIQRAHSHPT